MSKYLLELKEMKLEIFLIIIITITPIILFDSQSEFLQHQSFTAMLTNSVIFITLYFFIKSLKIPNRISRKILVLLTIWTCILPVIFYYSYSRDPISFSFNEEYLTYQNQFNKNDFDINDQKFIEIKPNIIEELNNPVFEKMLPQNSDTIILLKNYIILSPHTTPPSGGMPAPKTYLKLFDRFSGKLLLKFEKKTNLFESYNYFNNNINFKVNKVEKPEIGITFFDFWNSSIIGFRDNLIIPLNSWIVTLSFIITSIFIIPIFDFIKTKYISSSKTKNGE